MIDVSVFEVEVCVYFVVQDICWLVDLVVVQVGGLFMLVGMCVCYVDLVVLNLFYVQDVMLDVEVVIEVVLFEGIVLVLIVLQMFDKFCGKKILIVWD